jgi:hypothetical protein
VCVGNPRCIAQRGAPLPVQAIRRGQIKHRCPDPFCG